MQTIKWLQLLFMPKFTFGILGFSLGGGKESSAFSEVSESDITKRETADKTQTGATTTTGEQVSTSGSTTDQTVQSEDVLSLLDEETQAVFQGLLTDLAAGGSSAELISELNERALDAEDTLTGLVDPIVANARANLEENLGASIQGLARSAGSSQNSIVQQLGLAEGARVEREIADLAATLGLQVEGAITEQQQGAVGLTEDLATQLGDLLKGATQTGVSTETTQAVQALEEILKTSEIQDVNLREVSDVTSLVDAIERASGSGSTKGASAGISFGI